MSLTPVDVGAVVGVIAGILEDRQPERVGEQVLLDLDQSISS